MFENVNLKSIPKILKSVNSTEGMFDGVDASLADQVKDALENRLDKTDACYLDIYESKPVKQVKEMRDAEMKARKKVCEAKPKSESVEAAFGNIGNSSNDNSKELGG